ncbi:hypothetical protein PoB_002948200 [Plakobranchus ocellatus]|uniref:Uncharacterized protein n=1 Tax=Plakobranchus ocellatus TaxID=259542 RepID=A0AAV4A6R9_9GAST|nr:hypothetical protein PoB_002948200 [Plakobranchus ocellatus]
MAPRYNQLRYLQMWEVEGNSALEDRRNLWKGNCILFVFSYKQTYMQVHRQRDKMGGRFDTSGYEEMTGVEEETSVHVGLITNMEIGDLTSFTSNLLSSPDGLKIISVLYN